MNRAPRLTGTGVRLDAVRQAKLDRLVKARGDMATAHLLGCTRPLVERAMFGGRVSPLGLATLTAKLDEVA